MKFNPGYLLILTGFLAITEPVPAQDVITDPKEMFSEAEFFFLAEDYEEALYFYTQLLNIFPDNANYNFKVGDTYLNIPGQEFKSIPYLEKAITHTTIKYKKRSFKEKQAPHYAIFSLGNAYRMNNETEKALETYEMFTSSDDFEGNYNLKIVEDEVRACQRSKIIQDVPIDVKFIKLDSPINTNSDNINAVLSGDGNTMIFVTSLAFYDAIHLSHKINGEWTEPEVLNPQVGSDGDMYPTSLSFNGKELYMVKRSDNNDDLYVSTLGTDFWSKARELGPNINTAADETHAAISADGKLLYFTSSRRGGFGELDIYVSERLPSGEWGEGVNLGPVINTEYDEETPFPSDNGKQLYFSSKGHFNMGGFDIFFSNKDEEAGWKDPINIGYPINTTTDDLFFYPIGNGSEAYFSRIEREGAFTFDIYHLAIGPRTRDFSDMSGKSRFNDDFRMLIILPGSGDSLSIDYLKDSDEFRAVDPAVRIKIQEKK